MSLLPGVPASTPNNNNVKLPDASNGGEIKVRHNPDSTPNDLYQSRDWQDKKWDSLD